MARVISKLRRGVSPRQVDEKGSILVIALVYVVAVSLIVVALGSWASNDLANTSKFVAATQMEASARSTAEVAINNIRYSPLIGANQTLDASPPSYCWGSSAPSSQSFTYQNGSSTNTTSYTYSAWCSTSWNPLSAASRVVNIYVCLAKFTAAECANAPFLQVVVTFDDYPSGSVSAPIQGVCTIWCGEGMTINSWDWSATSAAQLPNVITVTSTAPTSASVASSAYIPAAYSSSGQSVIIQSTSPSSCTITSGVVQFVGVGVCVLTFDDPGNVQYAPAPEVTQSFTIAPGVQGGLVLASVQATYGGSLALSTSGGSGTGAVSYTVSSGTATGCSISTTSGSPVLTTTSAGTCIVTATKAGDASYQAQSTGATTVDFAQAPLTITPQSTSTTYGYPSPTISPAYSGFVNGDTPAVLTKAPTCTTTVNSASPVGTYSSSCNGATATNYAISYGTGTVSVTAEPLTITALSTTMTTGAQPPTITASYSGFVNNESASSLTHAPTCSAPGVSSSTGPGVYTTSCSGAVDSNYAITYVAGTLTISGPPGVPQSVDATIASSSSYKVVWAAPASNGGSPITSYSIRYAKYTTGTPSWTTVSASSSATSTTITGLTAGFNYEFEVAAVSSQGTGVWSSAVTAGYPTLVSGQQAQANLGSGTSSTFTITLPAAPTNGNDLVLAIGDATGNTVQSVTQNSPCSSWSQVVGKTYTSGRSSYDTEIWVAQNEQGCTDTSISITMSGRGALTLANATEWAGLSWSTVATSASNGGTGSGTTIVTGPLASRAAYDLIFVAGVTSANDNSTLTASGGATVLSQTATGPNYQGAAAYFVDSGTTVTSINLLSGSASGNYDGVAVALATN